MVQLRARFIGRALQGFDRIPPTPFPMVPTTFEVRLPAL
jgi:hypothetical protein